MHTETRRSLLVERAKEAYNNSTMWVIERTERKRLTSVARHSDFILDRALHYDDVLRTEYRLILGTRRSVYPGNVCRIYLRTHHCRHYQNCTFQHLDPEDHIRIYDRWVVEREEQLQATLRARRAARDDDLDNGPSGRSDIDEVYGCPLSASGASTSPAAGQGRWP